jgi:hypothetical protein
MTYDKRIDDAIPHLLEVAKIAGGRLASWSTAPAHYQRRVRWVLALASMCWRATHGRRYAAVAHFTAAALYGEASDMSVRSAMDVDWAGFAAAQYMHSQSDQAGVQAVFELSRGMQAHLDHGLMLWHMERV